MLISEAQVFVGDTLGASAVLLTPVTALRSQHCFAVCPSDVAFCNR